MYTASFLFINIITNISSTCKKKKKKARGGHTVYDIIFHSEYTAGTLLESKQFGHGGVMSPFVTSCHITTHSFTGHKIKDFPAATANMLNSANVPTGFKPTLLHSFMQMWMSILLDWAWGLSCPGPQLAWLAFSRYSMYGTSSKWKELLQRSKD